MDSNYLSWGSSNWYAYWDTSVSHISDIDGQVLVILRDDKYYSFTYGESVSNYNKLIEVMVSDFDCTEQDGKDLKKAFYRFLYDVQEICNENV